MDTAGDLASQFSDTPHRGPTVPPPGRTGLASVLERNIRALEDRRRREEAAASGGARLAELITRFTGSMPFVYLHLVVVAGWIAVNAGLIPGVPRFDPTFVIMATWASVEAIFLSTFVLISQNRQAAAADKRADLDLHINLLAEHELSRLADLVARIAEKLEIDPRSIDLDEVRRDIEPERVLDALERQEQA